MKKLGFKIVYWLAYAICFPIYRPKVVGRSNVPDGACIICANHTAIIDAVLLVLALGRKGDYGIMAKAELFKNKLFSAFFDMLNAIPVKRGKSDISAVKKSLTVLKNEKKLMIFPEGTRVGENETSDAKSGIGMLAAKTAVPILPVYITPGRKAFRGCSLICGKAYMPDGSDYKAIADTAMDRIRLLAEPRKGGDAL